MNKPVPKPRPPPKPDVTTFSNKPPILPKPRRPPPFPGRIDINDNSGNFKLPERPFKPAHLIPNNTYSSTNSEQVTEESNEDLYDDVIVESDKPSDDSENTNPPRSPWKPVPTLATKTESTQNPVKDALTLKPIPTSRTSLQASPSYSPKANRSPEPVSGSCKGEAARLRDGDKKNYEQTCLTNERVKPQKPPKPLWHEFSSKQNRTSTGNEGEQSDKLPIKPIKKRIATRRQNPGKTTMEIKRRPPPPPPQSDEESPPKRGGSLKGPSVPCDQLTINDSLPKAQSTESIPKTAEEQSLYSYAYEHTFVPSMKSPVKKSSPDSACALVEDASYIEPDSTTVAGLMEAINSKDLLYTSDETYEIPETEIQDEDSDNSSSDNEHDYEVPCDSPPPVLSHKCGSYDVTFTDELDEDEDEEDDYVEPPDAQGPIDDEFDDGMFLGDETSVEEPLYQEYTARTLQRDRTLSRKRTDSGQIDSSFEDITKGTLRNMRMLWCELPEVVSSGILDKIDSSERKRQEAMFEVVTSEASYLKSLKILKNHFINSPELTPGTLQSVIEKPQYHTLFSNVDVVVNMSQRFLDCLRQRSKESLVVSSISDIILEFASKDFEVYVKYCSNQIHQDRVLKDLRKSPQYQEGIERLEKSSAAQCLSLQSFLVLPMQRITRLPLLVDAICHRCEPGSDEFMKTDEALKAVHKVVRDCNEGARKIERMEEMFALRPQIEFTEKPIVLVSSNRWLLRRGEVVLVIEQFRSPISKRKLKLKPVYMFLFNDLLLITKKKGESRYRVLDYAFRNMTKVEESTDMSIQLEHMLSLILLENCNGKTKDFLLSAESETDKTRWMEAFNPPKAEREGEKVYGDWDCPQVQAIHEYTPQQPDELALHKGDVINVQRKLPDGWHYGERLCDGICGWFPANYTENILNEHVRARNLLQRYRLLAASKHLIGAVQTMKTTKASKLTLKTISATLQDRKRETAHSKLIQSGIYCSD